MIWLILGLLCGLFYGLFHIFTKKYVAKSNAEYFAYLSLIFSVVITLPFVLALWPKFIINYYFLLGIILVGLISWITRVLYMTSLKIEDVSKTTPLLTITPLFTLIIAMFWLKEFPGWIGIIGIILLITGLYFLNYRKDQLSVFEPFLLLVKKRGVFLMFIVALLYGFGSVTDKFVINHSNILSRVLLGGYFSVLFQTIHLSLRDRYSFVKKAKGVVKENWRGLLVITILFYLYVIFQMWGISLIYTAYIISLKRTAAIYTVIIAYFVFKERKNFAYVLSGAILMLLGAVLMLF